MTAEELAPWLAGHWAAAGRPSTGGTYRPSPVRRVVIPKSGVQVSAWRTALPGSADSAGHCAYQRARFVSARASPLSLLPCRASSGPGDHRPAATRARGAHLGGTGLGRSDVANMANGGVFHRDR